MKRTADRLFGDRTTTGPCWAPAATRSACSRWRRRWAAHVRVGLEDSLYIGKGQLARSNAEQVRKIRRILEELSLEIATPDEARAMLGLKGGANVAF